MHRIDNFIIVPPTRVCRAPNLHPPKPQRDSQAMLAEARRLLAAGELDQAERHFQRAVAKDQSSPGTIAHLAEFYFNQHRPHQALPFFMRMTTLQPNNAIAWRNRGFCWRPPAGGERISTRGRTQTRLCDRTPRAGTVVDEVGPTARRLACIPERTPAFLRA